MRNEWLANTCANQDSKMSSTVSKKCYSAREKFLMDQSSSEKGNAKLGSSQMNKGSSNQFYNLSESFSDCNDKTSDHRTSNIESGKSNLRTAFFSPVKKSIKCESTWNEDQECNKDNSDNHESETMSSKKQSVGNTSAFLSKSTSSGNSQEHNDNLMENSETLNDHCSGSKELDSLNIKQPIESNVSIQERKVGHAKDSNVISCNSDNEMVTNGTIITNGWPDIKDYSVERKKENEAYSIVDANASLKSCEPQYEKGSLESHEKQESAKENEILLETLVKGKKESKVSKFVRMFNKKEANVMDNSERSSVRRNQSRVWGMCMQVQSPSFDDEYFKGCSYKKSEGDSVKSEPLIDNQYSDLESSLETGLNGSQTSSSFPDAEAMSYQSLDIDRENLIAKKKNPNMETDSKVNVNLIRGIGGRRSFDKPQRPKNLPKRSNTLDDDGNGVGVCARSSKTLPATPTSSTPKSEQNPSTSHPFYRRFYSHCMILPMKKKKKESAKKPANLKGPDIIIDTSSLCQNNEVGSRDLDGEGVASKGNARITEKEQTDSPKKIPVIDDLLAEIMENVNIMEHEMEDVEIKRNSVIFSKQELLDSDCELRNNSSINTDNVSIVTGESGVAALDDGATNDSLDPSDWSGAASSSHSPTPTNGTGIVRSNSRISSLISKFEQVSDS